MTAHGYTISPHHNFTPSCIFLVYQSFQARKYAERRKEQWFYGVTEIIVCCRTVSREIFLLSSNHENSVCENFDIDGDRDCGDIRIVVVMIMIAMIRILLLLVSFRWFFMYTAVVMSPILLTPFKHSHDIRISSFNFSFPNAPSPISSIVPYLCSHDGAEAWS